MNKFSVKLILSTIGFLFVNLWLIGKASAKGGVEFIISPVFEETLLFVLLQLHVIGIYFIKPLKENNYRIIYWCVSELYVLATVFFWGIFIVGPIWFK